jgi:hypothetical protein
MRNRFTTFYKRIAAILLVVSSPAFAQTPAHNPQKEMIQSLQKLLLKPNNKEAVGQVLVIGSMLGCTQREAGQEQTLAFYHDMKEISKTVESYCQQGNATEARTLLLSTFEQHAEHEVAQAALGCYEEQKQTITSLGGARMAKDAANYVRWARDTELAAIEMKESDVCRGYPIAQKPKTPAQAL